MAFFCLRLLEKRRWSIRAHKKLSRTTDRNLKPLSNLPFKGTKTRISIISYLGWKLRVRTQPDKKYDISELKFKNDFTQATSELVTKLKHYFHPVFIEEQAQEMLFWLDNQCSNIEEKKKDGIHNKNVGFQVGVSKLFNEGAPGIVKGVPVKVSKAFQEAFIKVDEEGATAGAFTGLLIFLNISNT